MSDNDMISNQNSGAPRARDLFVPDLPLSSEGVPKIRKLLIANRGEIACRIIATCRILNVTSVAIYVEEDRLSRHVLDADETVCIGSIGSSPSNPFLDIDLLVKTAIDVGAHAVHPGYGYLSENPQFADRVREAGLIFVGPSGAAMSTLGDKRSSKDYLRAHSPDTPLIPGYVGTSLEVSDLEREASKIGYPVMLKASAGGGGKGMRIVHQPSQLRSELERVQSEAQRSFGSSDCILEKFIENSKHVEIQVVGDQHGHVVSFFERDCSVQRRNQKVIEETPCLFLDPETRKQMAKDAVRIVRLIGYEGAGTVEFVFDTDSRRYYFLEVNTRLQVEHPITEEVVGVDLVALQLFVASGGRLLDLPLLSNLTQRGHAIECRLCAEDPQRDFFPSHGKVWLWKPGSPGTSLNSIVRYETSMPGEAHVSIHFDSMICKIVVWAPTRAQAIERMVKELSETACIGVRTNQLFLRNCLTNPAFQDLGYKTSFVKTNLADLLQNLGTRAVPAYLSVIPSLYLRTLRSRTHHISERKAFGAIRKRFRNQSFDPLAVSCEVISTTSLATTKDDHPRVEACFFGTGSGLTGHTSSVHIYPISNLDTTTTSIPVSQELTADYNTISQAIRTGAVLATHAYTFSDMVLRPAINENTSLEQPSWRGASSFDFSLDGQRIRAYLVIPTDGETGSTVSSNETMRVLCHLPELGEWIEFHRDTLLSFCVNRRKEVTAAGEAEKTIKAPMPCKILSINKALEDEVAAGDIVMVIESMKMEITITVGVAGKFHTRWKEGDAVNEGSILCSVD